MSPQIPPPKELNLSADSSPAASWKKFRIAWNNYELATGLMGKPNEVRLATFLSVIGEEGMDKYQSFYVENDEERTIEMVL